MTGWMAHESFSLEREYEVSVSRVFAAWEDVEGRALWQKPAAHLHLVYDRADFRVGGRDVSRCWADDESDAYQAIVHYQDIVPDHRIIMSETVSKAGTHLASALVTVEMCADNGGTRLRLTLQIVGETNSEIFAGYREGWGALIENLALHFEAETTS
ncbi:hypothetical protein AWH62_03930 [Maricaulis sp. W15]|uniref:Uncharacterized protein YndB with AHSA1/START domain n=1 Tax=Maricaulis maris TaxID=74318 RepID=A0A495D1T2_9PROT|nr:MULTISPECIES: SRPBCC domain-containing protein [Maricaulis]OLF77830.1 hypothetical protein AWH62_03930 [Maricaulis sp. W15]RKQ95504.1 uncharacterized protein YndB with AHSA1/START domain [Maricaulis maris]